MTKTTLLAASLLTASTFAANAGGMAEPVMEPTIVIADVQDAAGTRAGFFRWMILAGIIIAVGAN